MSKEFDNWKMATKTVVVGGVTAVAVGGVTAVKLIGKAVKNGSVNARENLGKVIVQIGDFYLTKK